MPSPLFILTQGHAGDRLGASLVSALRSRFPRHELVGVGGPGMEAAGVRLVARADGISAMGWTGLLPVATRIWHVMSRVIQETRRSPPACVVAVDVWQPLRFIHRRAPELAQVPHVCYLPPGPNLVGASRVHKAAAGVFRSIITPFPHQARLFEAAGGRVRLAAHSGLQAMRSQVVPVPYQDREPVLALLPGSRALEVRYGLPVQYEAARQIRQRHPELRPVVCCTDAEVEAVIRRRYPEVETNRDSRGTMARARFALICSGTAVLEAALLGCPGVVTYNASPLQRWEWHTFHVSKLADLRARGIASPYIALPNILSGRPLYPEFLDCTADQVAEGSLKELAADPTPRLRELDIVAETLCWEDAGRVVSEEVALAVQ